MCALGFGQFELSGAKIEGRGKHPPIAHMFAKMAR